MIHQFKCFVSLLLVVMVLFSAFSIPAYAVDEVYNIADDVAPAPVIYYTEDYYPGLLVQLRSSMTFANNRVAHGSFATMNYNPSWIYKSGSSYPTGSFSSLTPSVIADQSDVSAIYSVPRTTLLNGSLLIVYLPSTSDAYFDFQSSNIAFDQQDANANTFYINGTLTFNLRNLWSLNGTNETTSFYLASDPLAVQLLIDGKAYGDIIDVSGYTSPFTSFYGNAVPANASVTFDNLKVYYQGDTPDMVGFRVYTGSAFTDGQYNYNSGGEFVGVDVTNTVTMRFSDLPDITFVNEGGDGYAGDLSSISGILNDVFVKLSDIFSSLGASAVPSLRADGGEDRTGGYKSIFYVVREGFLGLRSLLVSSQSRLTDINTLLNNINSRQIWYKGDIVVWPSGVEGPLTESKTIWQVLVYGLRGLATNTYEVRDELINTVFPWQSYNMETHQLNAATNITGQNDLFFTAFQSIEDKLGRLAYVFGSDEDLALKDSADPGTDAFRDKFGGGASLSQISDGAEVVAGVDGLFDSGYDFGDAFTEISGESMFIMWFTAENASAIDSTGSVMVLNDSDPYHMQIYYDRLQEVAEKRDWGDD